MTKKYYLWILGCQMNKSDAERIVRVLDELNYQKTDNENQADLIIAVACSVRQSAVDRIFGKARIWNRVKEKKPITTILTGCVLPADRPKMAKIFDYIFEINDLAKLADFLKNKDLSLPQTDYFKIHPKYSTDFQAYVPISNGCNNFCSYCVVPYVRGQEISRPSNEIIEECKNLINKGYKEITLIGQNVNSYQDSKTNGETQNFVSLLRKINDLKGDFWLRFITSHPKDMSDELIETVADGEKICEYIHLPVQSGDNEILKKMNRGYTREHYLELIDKIRKKIPGVAISTDMIVGFPGETKKQFKNTVRLMKRVKFDMAYIAQYSPRSGTAAFQLTDDVPKKEKKKREEILTKILKKTALEYNKKLVGKIVEVLVENIKTKDFPQLRPLDFARGLRSGQVRLKTRDLFGKTRTFKTVKFSPNQAAKGFTLSIGQFVKIKINKAQSFGLEGILTCPELE